MATLGQQGLLRNFRGIVSKQFEVSFSRAMINAVEDELGKVNVYARSLASAFDQDTIDRVKLQTTNDRIARGARQAAADAYEIRQPRRQIEPYRVGQGRVGYDLIHPALTDAGHANASGPFQIVPFNFELLDRQTRVGSRGALWRQINSGALPNSGKKPRPHTVKMDRGASFVLQFPDLAIPAGVLKRPARGFFIGETGDDRFVARGGGDLVPLRGSRATQFMDAAVAYMARETGPEYVRLYVSLLGDAQERARLAAREVVLPKRLGGVKPTVFEVTVG